YLYLFFFQAEDGIRDGHVTGVQTCALPICTRAARASGGPRAGPIPIVADQRGGRVMRKREPRWQSAAERARVAAELLEEAESLTETSTIATPADVRRAGLPPPIRVELPPEPAVPL